MDTTSGDSAERASEDSGATGSPAPESPQRRGVGRPRREDECQIETGGGSQERHSSETTVSEHPPKRKREMSSKQILTSIGEEFTKLRDSNRTQAWQTLQKRLMENVGSLVPDVFPPKDFFTLSMDIEGFVKQEQGIKEGSALEEVQKFLSGETLIPEKVQ